MENINKEKNENYFDNDFIITLLSEKKNLLGYFCSTKNTIIEAQKRHNLNIISSVIYGRAMNGVILLGGNLKNQSDYLSMIWNCTGPVGKINVEVDYAGNCRGFIENGNLEYIEGSIENGNLLAEQYIGFGELLVSKKSFDDSPPYNSIVLIQAGEISQDISNYLEESLQIQSLLRISVSIDNFNNITNSGGLLLMGLPGVKDEDLKMIYDEFNNISISEILENEDFNKINDFFSKYGFAIIGRKNIRFKCRCDSNTIKNMLKNFTKEKLKDFINDNNGYDVKCQYCGSIYHFDENFEEIKQF